ncbi:MAG: tRNA (cytidine(34)-2'-O)-methyltransferase [Spirochaetales bacterium]|nr:tRNA (cytidine(34)-2'-O)-methyltransferase [Spirochaetales bacterium]MCF7938388.1 tRNA (cytidine(34)-2'-O)-methyltransferase [Spirochaetales bacterium]
MIHIVLVEPEIPQNTGNIARTCAALGATLHLVHPLGFSTDDRYLKRAGLDYWRLVEVRHHKSISFFFETLTTGKQTDSKHRAVGQTEFYLVTRYADQLYTEVSYPDGCYLIFGRETSGLPEKLHSSYPDKRIRIPMRNETRSLNLSNAAAIIGYEAMRRQQFAGLELKGGHE